MDIKYRNRWYVFDIAVVVGVSYWYLWPACNKFSECI